MRHDDTGEGVAQRVIAQWKREPTTHREMYGVQDGLTIMHRELSAEAQRVWEEQDYTEGEFSGMSYLCAKLGLHIDRTKNRPRHDEPEDS